MCLFCIVGLRYSITCDRVFTIKTATPLRICPDVNVGSTHKGTAMISRVSLWIVVAVVPSTVIAPMARADLFDLTANSDCGSLCGTVSVTQDGTGLDITASLQPNVNFVRTGNHNALTFDLAGIPVIFSGLTSGFAVVTGGGKNPPFGTFEYAISCTACGPGGSNPLHGPFSFTIMPVTGTITPASLVQVNGVYFSADIINSAGATGSSGAPNRVPAVPEPTAIVSFGTGLLAVAYVVRRRIASAL